MNKKADPKTILTVDDSAGSRELLKKCLSTSYHVLTAENGTEALKILRADPKIAAVILRVGTPAFDGIEVLRALGADRRISKFPVIALTAGQDVETQIKALDCGARDVLTEPYHPQILLCRVRNLIAGREAEREAEQNCFFAQQLRRSQIDQKTGIYNREAFCRIAAARIAQNPEKKFAIFRWDMDRFKIFNDVFGTTEGDALLARIGKAYQKRKSNSVIYGHWDADHFVTCCEAKKLNPEAVLQEISCLLSQWYPNYELIPRLGIYEVDDSTRDVTLMCDRAYLALRSIKGIYDRHFAYYDESMRAALLEEQEIDSKMDTALNECQFEIYLQPQYNYATGEMIGSEALVRWNRPGKGPISPQIFIPLFEKNGFITKLDTYVWEQVCMLQKRWEELGLNPVPIAVNVSRRDLYDSHLCDGIEGLVRKYGIPPALLHLEITESAYMDDSEQLIKVAELLRFRGFQVEIDDFGSGYSSLNTLKSVPADLLKLDMKFLEQKGEGSRSGSILSSVIRMAHWIRMPVIAEGVETKEQAEYLKSMGCLYMQGYYFSKPVTTREYEELLRTAPKAGRDIRRFDNDIRNAADFFDASAQETLLFNSFLGGACILEYTGGNAEAIRINDRFFEALGTTREEYEDVQTHILDRFDDQNRAAFVQMLHQAIQSGRESECEVRSKPLRADGKPIWSYLRARCLAGRNHRYLFYLSVENISIKKELMHRCSEQAGRLSEVLNGVPCGILNYEISDHVRLTYLNDTAASLFGYSRDEYTQKFMEAPMAAIHPGEAGLLLAEIRQAVSKKQDDFSVRYRHLCKGGGWRWVGVNGRITDHAGDRIRVSTVQMDVDQQIQADQPATGQEQEWEQKRAFWEKQHSAALCGILLYVHKNGKYELTEANETAWRSLGYSDERQYLDAKRENFPLNEIHPDDRANIQSVLENAAFGEQAERNCRMIRMDGAARWVHAAFLKREWENGEKTLQVAFSDITEQKQREQRAFGIHFFGEEDEVLIIDTEQNTSVMLFSKWGERNGGIPDSLGERIASICEKRVQLDDVPKVREFLNFSKHRMNSGPRTLQYRYRGTDGKVGLCTMRVLWIEGSSYFVCSKAASNNVLPIGYDPEPDGREYRKVLEAGGLTVLEWNFQTGRFFCSDTYFQYESSRYDPFDVLSGKKVSNAVHPDDQKEFSKNCCREWGLSNPGPAITVRLKMTNGSYRWTQFTLLRFLDAEGQKSQAIATLKDVQDETVAEREQERMLANIHAAAVNLPVGIAVYEYADRLVPQYFSDKTCELFGISREERNLRTAKEKLASFLPDLDQFPEGSLEKLLAGETLELSKLPGRKADGSCFWLRAICRLIRLENGRRMLYAVLIDMTEQVDREQELSALLSLTPGGILKYSAEEDGQFDLVSANLPAMLGYTPEEFREKFCNQFSLMVWKEDRERVLAEIAEQVHSSSYDTCEFRIETKSGALKWVQDFGHMVMDAGGKHWFYVAVYDIDDRKEMEERLRTENQMTHALISNMPGGVIELIIQGQDVSVAYLSEGIARLFGFTEQELRDRYCRDLFFCVHLKDRPAIVKAWSYMLESRQRFCEQYRRLCRDGRYIWVNLTANVVLGPEGRLCVYGSYTDISSIKQLENKLQIEQNKIKIALQNSDISIWEYNVRTNTCIRQHHFQNNAGSGISMENTPESAVEQGLVHPKSECDYLELHRAVCRGERSPSRHILMYTSNGSLCWQRITYHTIFENGSPVGAIGLSVDITEYMQMKKQYQDEMDYLEAVHSDDLIDKARADISRGILESYTSYYGSGLIHNDVPYLKMVEALAAAALTDEQKQRIRTTFDPVQLMGEFRNGKKQYEIEYQRILQGADESVWVELNAKIYQEPDSGAVKAFLYEYDINDKRQMKAIVNRIVERGYEILGILDIQSGTLQQYRSTAFESEYRIPHHIPYSSLIKEFVNHLVVEECRQEAMEALSLNNICKQLQTEAVYSCAFTILLGGMHYRKKWEFSYLDDQKRQLVYTRSDITEVFEQQERQQERLRKALTAANEAAAAKSEFLSNVSHDMRTPLNGVIGYTDLALDSSNFNEVQSYLRKIKASGTFLLSLINDTLNLSKIENRKIVLKQDTISCRDLLESVLTTVRPSAEEKHIFLVVDKSRIMEAMIRADILRTQEIFLNILSNAIKFTPEGGTVWLNIECLKQEKNRVYGRIVIRDNGIGMSPEFLPKVFEPFSQEHTKGDENSVGSGLGLSIVKRLVDLMHGRIEVKSRQGEGTEFAVYLDFERVSDTSSETPPPPAPGQEDVLSGKRVLLCEDHPLNTELAKRLLEKKEVRVTCAENGREGVELFSASPEGSFDAILMDIRMPVMDGLEATAAIRRLQRADAKSVPIIALTANAFDEDVMQAQRAGMNAYLAKPIHPDLLYQILAQMIPADPKE